ncbi:MarR family winged helix-turn-helix transcriptional regulator [Sphingomonas sp. MMS24-J13]|uniref:MarR family winged helix-turn-helix transcriptional regulator n=1 Tax=Sphingomonas sp. MMS24-J13 TaxID=3238686 RepID=UPI00384C25F9
MQSEDPVEGAVPDSPSNMLFTLRIARLLDLLRRSRALANRREFGLSDIEWRVMTQVGAHAPLSLNQLADLVALDRGQLSRTVKTMVARGLLDRKRRPGGPAIIITLSDEGTAEYARMLALARERNAFLVGDIAEDDLDRAAEVLSAVARNAQRLLELEQGYTLRARTDADRD